jgi:hypothetical protein
VAMVLVVVWLPLSRGDLVAYVQYRMYCTVLRMYVLYGNQDLFLDEASSKFSRDESVAVPRACSTSTPLNAVCAGG